MNSIPGQILKGQIRLNPTSWQRFAERHEGKMFDLIPREPKRSLTQNSYYWLFLSVIAAETGNDDKDLHEYFKSRFLPLRTIRITTKDGEDEYQRAASTTELSKLEFGEYLDKIAAATEIPLPDPEAAGYLPR